MAKLTESVVSLLTNYMENFSSINWLLIECDKQTKQTNNRKSKNNNNTADRKNELP